MGIIFGKRVISNPYLPRFKTVQFRKPKSKRKRIRKKWAKRLGNFKQVPSKSMYVFNDDIIVVHPDDLAEIKHMVTPL